jgi:hypothetical protein
MTLMPCFGPHQAPAEGMLIGRLLAGYGELEVSMCSCLIAIEGQFDTPIRQLFNERSAEKRIKESNPNTPKLAFILNWQRRYRT